MSKLAQVTRGKIKEKPRILIFGGEGVGKSTLAADAPNPIWADVEGGSGQLDVQRYPFYEGPNGHVPKTYQDVLDMVDDLIASPHSYETLVIDTLDRMESLLWRQMLTEDTKFKPKTIDEWGGGYGKGFNAALARWEAFALKLDQLRQQRNMTILLLAHSHIKAFKSPTLDSYDRYTLKMNEKAAGFFKEWCQVVGFACFEDVVSRQYEDERNRGVSTGRRLLKFERTAAHDGKTRFALPPQIEMTLTRPWAPFAKALSDAQDMTAEQLIEAIKVECERVGDDITTAKAMSLVAAANGNTAQLHVILERMKEKEGKAQ